MTGGPSGASSTQKANIQTALLGLLPMAIAEVGSMGDLERAAVAQRASETIASRADGMMFPGGAKGGKRGGRSRTARQSQNHPSVLGQIARGMAVLAHNPGGVTSLGVHACTAPHQDCPANEQPRAPHPALGRVVAVDDDRQERKR